MKRLFLAVPVPDDVKTVLMELQEESARIFGEKGRVHPDALHLTLRFYGDTRSDRIAPLIHELTGIASGLRPAETTVHGVTTFGRPDAPRVVVATISPDGDLRKTASSVEAHARTFGYEAERRPFRAHITLQRPKISGRLTPHALPLPVPFSVSGFVLMESVLKPDRAHYTVLERFNFGGSEMVRSD